jgi:uncharacterized protein
VRDDPSEWDTVAGPPREPAPEPGEPSRRGARRRETSGGRRLVPAGHVLLAVLVGFALTFFFDAAGLQKSAGALPFGARRSVAVAFMAPIAAVSHALYIDRPARVVRDALGNGPPGESDVAAQLFDLGRPTDRGTPAALPTPSKAAPLRCWVGGDSMTQVFGQSLVDMMRRTGVMKATLDYRISTGLSRPDYFDWPQHLRFVVEQTQPDVIVIMFGANDGQAVAYRGKVLDFGTPAWMKLYHKRVGEAMDIAMNGGRTKVYWIGQPIVRDTDFQEVLGVMNIVYEKEAARRPELTYVPTWALFADRNGEYSDYLRDAAGKVQLMRQADGVHLSLDGGERLARVVLDAVASDVHLTKP